MLIAFCLWFNAKRNRAKKAKQDEESLTTRRRIEAKQREGTLPPPSLWQRWKQRKSAIEPSQNMTQTDSRSPSVTPRTAASSNPRVASRLSRSSCVQDHNKHPYGTPVEELEKVQPLTAKDLFGRPPMIKPTKPPPEGGQLPPTPSWVGEAESAETKRTSGSSVKSKGSKVSVKQVLPPTSSNLQAPSKPSLAKIREPNRSGTSDLISMYADKAQTIPSPSVASRSMYSQSSWMSNRLRQPR